MLADASLPRTRVERCVELPQVNTNELERRACQGIAADTLVTVALARDGAQVLRVTRVWKSAAIRVEVTALTAELSRGFGTVRQVCLSNPLIRGYRWQQDGVFVTVFGDDETAKVELSYEVGMPRYEQSCSDDLAGGGSGR